jgi:hypothetical protein
LDVADIRAGLVDPLAPCPCGSEVSACELALERAGSRYRIPLPGWFVGPLHVDCIERLVSISVAHRLGVNLVLKNQDVVVNLVAGLHPGNTDVHKLHS